MLRATKAEKRSEDNNQFREVILERLSIRIENAVQQYLQSHGVDLDTQVQVVSGATGIEIEVKKGVAGSSERLLKTVTDQTFEQDPDKDKFDKIVKEAVNEVMEHQLPELLEEIRKDINGDISGGS